LRHKAIFSKLQKPFQEESIGLPVEVYSSNMFQIH